MLVLMSLCGCEFISGFQPTKGSDGPPVRPRGDLLVVRRAPQRRLCPGRPCGHRV